MALFCTLLHIFILATDSYRICFWIQICTKDQKQVLYLTANRKYEDEKGSKLCCFAGFYSVYIVNSIFVKSSTSGSSTLLYCCVC